MARKIRSRFKTVAMSWLNELQIKNFMVNGKSQFGEDDIILFIFQHIGETNSFFVDIGAGFYGHGRMSNTVNLLDSDWKGVRIDANNSDDEGIIKIYITPGNVLDVLKTHNVPLNFDLLSIDIDSFDLDILEKIVPEYKPRVICTEFNATLDPEKSIKLKYEEGYVWDETNKYGYSFGAAVKFCGKYGYKIILNHVNQNLFLVRGDLIEQTPVIEVKQTFYHAVNPSAEWETY